MDFIKKHWEKALLAVALLGVILVAVILMHKIDTLQENLRTAPMRPRPKDDQEEKIDPAPYTNAAQALTSGFKWNAMPHELFIPNIEPPPTNTVVEPIEPILPSEEEVVLLAVNRTPFKLLFKAYSWDETKQAGRNFQINFQFRQRTFFVDELGSKVADRYEDTGFETLRFERKIAKVIDPRLGGEVEKDISELVIQHPGDDPITLVLGQVAQEKEPVATILCNPGPDTQTQRYQIRRGQRFECAGKSYIVVDITPTQMLIKDTKTEEKQTIELRTSSPTPRLFR